MNTQQYLEKWWRQVFASKMFTFSPKLRRATNFENRLWRSKVDLAAGSYWKVANISQTHNLCSLQTCAQMLPSFVLHKCAQILTLNMCKNSNMHKFILQIGSLQFIHNCAHFVFYTRQVWSTKSTFWCTFLRAAICTLFQC